MLVYVQAWGRKGLKSFVCMGIPKLHHKTFSAHVKAVHAKIPEFKADIRQSAMNAVRSELRQCDDSLLDINTSYEGS